MRGLAGFVREQHIKFEIMRFLSCCAVPTNGKAMGWQAYNSLNVMILLVRDLLARSQY